MRTFAALALVLTMATSASADDKKGGAPAPVAAPAAPPKIEIPPPAKELDGLKPLVRGWNCTGTGTLPGPTPVTFTYTARVTSKWDLGNHWADWTYTRAKSKEGVPGIVAEGEWGFDGAAKKLLMQGMDNWGGYLGLTAAVPAAGSTDVAFEGDIVLNGQKMPVTFTFSVNAKAKKMKMTMAQGATKILDDDCK